MLKPSDECWRDGNGVVHMLLQQTFETVCTRRYRRIDERLVGAVPTCLFCIAEADAVARMLSVGY